MRSARHLAAALVLAAATLAAAEGLDLARWSHTASLELPGPGPAGVVEVPLTPEVSEMAAADLRDIRLVAEDGEEVGYVIRTARQTVTTTEVRATLRNQMSLPGRKSQVVADLHAPVLKNRVRVLTTGDNFRRRVTVEGSDDGRTWGLLRDGALVFRFAGEGAGGGAVERSEIAIPASDQRFLRLTVLHAPDDPRVVRILEVRASRRLEQPADTVRIPDVAWTVTHKTGATEIDVDLRHRQMPLDALTLHIDAGTFFRRVTVFGQEPTPVRRPGDPATPGRSEPPAWRLLATDVVFRMPRQAGTGMEESLAVRLGGAAHRVLRVRIEDQDDRPLAVTGLEVTRLVQSLAVPGDRARGLRLYVGNPDARPPAYEVAHYLDRLRTHGVAVGALGPLAPNLGHPVRTLPWSERYAALIWAALLAMTGALAYLVYRVAMAAKARASTPPPPP